ncbi:MAG: DUF86 domain-containing protein [Bacillota bacterium]|nr:DUF86 domain-containing protein [Bacillota bacterium]
MVTDVVLNKIQIIERCIKRINEEYEGNKDNLKNFTKQDSIILNIQRACESSIDLAMHLVSEKKLGIPQSSREVFDILSEHKLIDEALAEKLKAMVGFRNIAVHDYQQINLNIVENIIKNNLQELKYFSEQILKI